MIARGPGGGGGQAVRPGGGGGFGAWGRGMGMAGPPEKAKDLRRALRTLGLRLLASWPWIALALLLTVAGVGLTIVGPRLLANATNLLFDGLVGRSLPHGLSKAQVIAGLRAQHRGQLADMLSGMQVTPGVGVDFNAVGWALLLAALAYGIGSILTFGQGYVIAGVAQRTLFTLRQDVEAKLDRLPLSYFDQHERGDLLSRVTNDIDNIGTTLQQSVGQLLTSLLTVIGVLAMMVSINWLLAVVSLVVVPLSVGLAAIIARSSQGRFIEQWKWTGRLSGHVEQMHTGHALVQVFGHRERAIAELDELNDRMYRASFMAQFLSGIIQPAIQLVGNLNYVAIAAIGGYKVATGTLSLGDVQAFIQYSRQFSMPIMQLAGLLNIAQSGLASAERVFEFLDAEEEVGDAAVAEPFEAAAGRVEFDRVSFRYLADQPLIEDFSLTVEPGQTIAIVGPTGAGKTTVVNLLMRFYDVAGGAIRVDGRDLRSLPRDVLRRQFGMVLQDTWIFGGTIRDNILYGRPGSTEADLLVAARSARLDDFVRALPDGYDTRLDEDVSNLSAGQKQLLTIARAFLADRPILILDEATSSVDTRTEVLIQEAMASLRQGRTSFVIAHRLSTIRNADRIIVMDHGRIVEQGGHDELLARGGFYHDLYQSQFQEAYAEAV